MPTTTPWGKLDRNHPDAATAPRLSLIAHSIDVAAVVAGLLALYLKPVSKVMYCEECGSKCRQVHETVVRRVRQKSGVGAARGFEIVVTLDEKAFEGTGVFLLGAVLERFYREYAAVNHFTQTVIRSSERGEVMRWPVRTGARRAL